MKLIQHIIAVLIYDCEWEWLEHIISFICEWEMKFRRTYTSCTAARKLYENTGKIPEGQYCYSGCRMGNLELCPFWSYSRIAYYLLGKHSCGYCHLMKHGDFAPNSGVGLLWDMCKDCDINDNWEEENEV